MDNLYEFVITFKSYMYGGYVYSFISSEPEGLFVGEWYQTPSKPSEVRQIGWSPDINFRILSKLGTFVLNFRLARPFTSKDEKLFYLTLQITKEEIVLLSCSNPKYRPEIS